MSWNRLVIPFLLGVLATFIFAGTAQASQGVRWHANSGHTATRANITGSGWNNSNGIVYASVGIQNAVPTSHSTNGFQVGEYKSYHYTTKCGTGGEGYAVERVINDQSLCILHGGHTYGVNHRFAILLTSSCGGWCAYVDGSVIEGPYNNLGLPNGGYVVARAESYWTSATPSYWMTWGPSGYTPWQFSNNGGSSYTTIVYSNGGKDYPNWTLQGTPSPFSIYFSS
jgi:hypothetical protein